MNRDGRGNPGRIVLKNQPRLRFADLLRRRKTTLKAVLIELGISTYEALCIRCDRIGVTPPSQEEFELVIPPVKVNSPQEGVIVLQPLRVVEELSGHSIDPEVPADDRPGVAVFTDRPYIPNAPNKIDQLLESNKKRKKKDNQPTE